VGNDLGALHHLLLDQYLGVCPAVPDIGLTGLDLVGGMAHSKDLVFGEVLDALYLV